MRAGVDTGFFDGGGGLCHKTKMGVSMFTFIGMINLTMVLKSTNK